MIDWRLLVLVFISVHFFCVIHNSNGTMLWDSWANWKQNLLRESNSRHTFWKSIKHSEKCQRWKMIRKGQITWYEKKNLSYFIWLVTDLQGKRQHYQHFSHEMFVVKTYIHNTQSYCWPKNRKKSKGGLEMFFFTIYVGWLGVEEQLLHLKKILINIDFSLYVW